MIILPWSTLVTSLLLLNPYIFLFAIAYECINFAAVKNIVYCGVLYMRLCASIKDIFSQNK